MALVIKRRGRPTKAMVAAREALKPKPRNDAEVLADLTLRFDMLGKLTTAALGQNIRSLVVSGAPGVGKSYTVENVLEHAKGARYEIVRGTLSGVSLYKLGYAFRAPGNVIVLDDADGIFADEDALNVLKALCDSSATRRVHWLKESQALKEDDVPQQYDFHGAMVFISNINFQDVVDRGGNKFIPHFEALLSRSLYLDLQLHDRQAIALWVRHVAFQGKLFQREGVSEAVGKRILDFISTHRDNLRELSIRTLLKASALAKGNPNDWEPMARILLCRPS
jgi:hypothetical protein